MNYLMFLTDAATENTQNPGMGSWYYIVMMVVFFGLIYFMMIRPEKKRNKQTYNAHRNRNLILTENNWNKPGIEHSGHRCGKCVLF